MADLIVESRREGPVGVLTLIGEARLDTCDAIRVKGSALVRTGARHLLVDARALTFADSAAIGAMIQLQSELGPTEGRMILIGAPERLRKTISTMGLSGRIRSAPDEVTARAQLIR